MLLNSEGSEKGIALRGWQQSASDSLLEFKNKMGMNFAKIEINLKSKFMLNTCNREREKKSNVMLLTRLAGTF